MNISLKQSFFFISNSIPEFKHRNKIYFITFIFISIFSACVYFHDILFSKKIKIKPIKLDDDFDKKKQVNGNISHYDNFKKVPLIKDFSPIPVLNLKPVLEEEIPFIEIDLSDIFSEIEDSEIINVSSLNNELLILDTSLDEEKIGPVEINFDAFEEAFSSIEMEGFSTPLRKKVGELKAEAKKVASEGRSLLNPSSKITM